MNTRIKRIGVAITLMLLASQASLAYARGGGGVGGRGCNETGLPVLQPLYV